VVKNSFRVASVIQFELQNIIVVFAIQHHLTNSLMICPTPQPTSTAETLLNNYESTHPLTVANFRQMEDGAYWFERLLALENSWKERLTSVPKNIIAQNSTHGSPPKPHQTYDLVYAGGGLGLLHATVMQCIHGKNVCVFDKFTTGLTHRDWNISMPELLRLQDIGLLNSEEMESIIQRIYSSGFIAFHNLNSPYKTEPLWMNGVLDVAISANILLGILREKFLKGGGVILDGATFNHVWNNDGYAITSITIDNNELLLQSSVLIDCMGAYSPIARWLNKDVPFTHCCPTVGTISRGFTEGKATDEVNPEIGEILVTIDDADEYGRQLIWEGFPSKDDEFVTYLFFYDSIDSPTNKSLLDLYEVFFANLHRYKKAGENFSIGRPAFGMIPSILHRSVTRKRIVSTNHILSIGDASALSSPLTYCGFGSFVRNLERTTILLNHTIEENNTFNERLSLISAYEPQVSISANFAQYLVGTKSQSKSSINSTMNMIMGVLHKLPKFVSEELFRDTLSWNAYNRLMSAVPVYYPNAYSLLFQNGISTGFWWVVNFIGFALHELRKRWYLRANQIGSLQKNTTSLSFNDKVRFFTYRDTRVYP
jgi:lycopene cyclase CruA